MLTESFRLNLFAHDSKSTGPGDNYFTRMYGMDAEQITKEVQRLILKDNASKTEFLINVCYQKLINEAVKELKI